MEELRPNDKRASAAMILIWIMLGLEIIGIISGYFQYELLQTIVNGGEISEEAANANDTREQVIAIVYLITYIISVVMFIQWFRRAYYNLRLTVKFLSHTEGWAAGAWFVPFICLYRPYQIMKELYEETKKYLSKRGADVNGKITTNYLGIWWALWIIANIVGQITFRVSLRAETLDELLMSTKLAMVGNLIGIPLAVMAIKVIRDYSKVEPLLKNTKDEEQAAENKNDGIDDNNDTATL